ncbi:hypothetical protein MMC12_001846 [Toensbergia leucococca]|nr:hypothetical protein [Toensbergia leucococca]
MIAANDSQPIELSYDFGLWRPESLDLESTSTTKTISQQQEREITFSSPQDITPPNENEDESSFDQKRPDQITPTGELTPPIEIETLAKHALPIELTPSYDMKTSNAVELSTSTYVTHEIPMCDAHAPATTRLRHMIKHHPRIIVCPGVYDGLSARIALKVGFDSLYMTGAGTTASRLGAADLGIAHLHDMRTNAEMIANLQPDGPPLIADMDTGYGGPIVIDRAVQQYHLAGVAGFHIEDQVLQKRCGHLKGKEVVDTDTYISRIKTCKATAARLRSDIVIVARTDALQSRGYDDCIDRLRRARDAGADMGLLEAVASKEQARQAVLDLAPWPLCLNSVENGVSPLITVAEAQDMGFRVVIFSFAGLAPAYKAILETFELLKVRGVTGSGISPKTIFEVCGLAESMVVDEGVGGGAFVKGV